MTRSITWLRVRLQANPVLCGILLIGCLSIMMGFDDSRAATGACSPGYTITAGTSPSSIRTTVSGAPAGTVICLNNGSYGSLNLTSITKSSDVIIQSTTGIGATVQLDLDNSNHLKLQNLTIDGFFMLGARNITIADSKVISYSEVNATLTGANILIDSNTFNNINVPRDNDCEFTNHEGRLSIVGTGGSSAVGVKITNNHFGNGGDADGIQVLSQPYGLEIGPGNEFEGLLQADPPCDGQQVHSDPVQLYGSSHTVIEGNYFHDNDTAIMACDGGNTETIKNNIFANTSYAAVCAAHQPGLLIEHNTLFNNDNFRIDDKLNTESSTTPTTAIIRNNIGGLSIGGSGGAGPFYGSLTFANNVFTGATSPNISGTPAFAGEADPSTQAGIAGFRLVAGSAGKGAGVSSVGAADGTDIGSTYFGAVGPQSLVCDQILTSGANISAAISSPSAGPTICLEDGSYSGITLSGVNKSSMVTVRGINGAANVNVGALNIVNSSNVRLDGVTFSGGTLTGHHLEIKNSKGVQRLVSGVSQLLKITGTTANAAILIDNVDYSDIPNPCLTNDCVEGRISVMDGGNPSGITIANSYFSGGTSDGIQVLGDPVGVQIIGNEFYNIKSASGTHTDSIQTFYGGSGTVIKNNYFHDVETAFMAGDGGTNEQVIGNVFDLDGYPYVIVVKDWTGGLIAHNTMRYGTSCSWNSCGTLWVRTTTGLVVRNNIMGELKVDSGTITEDYNLINVGVVAHDHTITGLPTYVNGSPTTWANFALSPASKGHNDASDGLDMGATIFGSGGAGLPSASVGDIDEDGSVDAADLNLLKADYGKTAGSATTPAADLNGDTKINAKDLSILLKNWTG